MSILLSFNGQNYVIPTVNEVGWGGNLDDYLVAIAAGVLQKSGGSFTLASEVDFGASYGIKTKWVKSKSVNTATTGYFQLAHTDQITWRNNTNTGDLGLSVDSSDQLLFNGSLVGVIPANIVYIIGDQTIGGNKTFSLPIIGDITGNAGTVTNGVYTTGTQNIGGSKTFTSDLNLSATNNLVFSAATGYTAVGRLNASDIQVVCNTVSKMIITESTGPQALLFTLVPDFVIGSHQTRISATTPAASTLITNIPDSGVDCDFVMTEGAQSIAGSKTFTDSVNLSQINSSGVWGYRNRLINGDMKINQRYVTSLASISGTTKAYTLDRWYLSVISGTIGVSRLSTTPPSGFVFYTRSQVTSAYTPTGFENFSIGQNIEANNMIDLSFGTADAKQITISFWVKSDQTGTFAGSVRNFDHSRSYVFQYSISSSNTWEYKSVTIVGETSGTWVTSNTNVEGLLLTFDLGSGPSVEGSPNTWLSGNYLRATGNIRIIPVLNSYLEITGIQLEIGSISTSFEYRPIQQELIMCQRYYEKSYGFAVVPATTDQNGSIRGARMTGGFMTSTIFQVLKRAYPTITSYSPSTGTSGKIRNYASSADETATPDNITEHGFTNNGTTATVSEMLGYQYIAQAEL